MSTETGGGVDFQIEGPVVTRAFVIHPDIKSRQINTGWRDAGAKLEEAIGLAGCELDRDAAEFAGVLSEPQTMTKLKAAISLVNSVANSEGVALSPERLAVFVGLVLEGAHLSPDRWLRQVLQMIK